jgi:hypothetical protein
MDVEQRSGLLEQQADNGDEVQTDAGLGHALRIFGQAAEAGCPGR